MGSGTEPRNDDFAGDEAVACAEAVAAIQIVYLLELHRHRVVVEPFALLGNIADARPSEVIGQDRNPVVGQHGLTVSGAPTPFFNDRLEGG